MAVSAARRVAYEVLLRVFEQDAYADRVFRAAASDLDERLRRSEIKKRQLQRRIKDLIGEG